MSQQLVTTATITRRSNSDDDVIIWTALTPEECSKGMRWFSARSHKEQAQVLALSQEEILPRLQRKHSDRHGDAYMRLAALLLAIRENGFDLVRKRGFRVAGHKQFAQFDQLRAATLESIRERKKAPLRKQVLAFWGEVCTLKRHENTGFLLIARYLLQAHKVKVSPQYLAKLWKELEGGQDGIQRN